MERYEASKGGDFPHAMTSGEWSKPLLCPPAQGNQLSCMERDRVERDGTQDGSAGQADHRRTQGQGQRRTAGQHNGTTRTQPPHPTGLPPNLLLGAAVNGEKYPVSKNIYKM